MAIPATQAAVQVKAFGLDNIEVAQIPVPSPGPGEVLVRINARPVNPSDVFCALGVYPGYKPTSFPAVLGLEGVGHVAALGPGCSGRLAAGQRVVAVNWRPAAGGNGTWQQYMAVQEEDLVPVPDDLSDEAACQALINPVPVIGMFQELAVPKGDYVIVTAAGSSLGRMALSYARAEGIKILATCRRAEQIPELKELGAEEAFVLNTDEDSAALTARVSELTGGRGAWGALDAVAGRTPVLVAPAVRQGGSIIVYGAMSGVGVEWNVGQALFRMVALKGFWLVPWLDAQPREAQRELVGRVLQLMCEGVLPPTKADVRPLEEARAAIRDNAAVGRTDKIVLRG